MIDKKDILSARDTLEKYRTGKQNLDNRIVEEEQFWKRRHWEILNKEGTVPPTSGWLFNSITNKHADAMDSYPEVKCLPREQSDEESAKILSEILPVVFERNNFESTYSDNWWYKLKHGCSAYGVFWNNDAHNGLGDVTISRIDLLNIFWEPGITKLENSENLFIVSLVPTDKLRLKNKNIRSSVDGEVKKYIYDDVVDTSDKTVVIDWYYKAVNSSGNTILHYCKFADEEIIFASENEKEYKETGWYEDGEYPVVLDVMYPVEGTPAGFGVIAVAKESQLYIDKLDEAIMKTAMMKTKPRYMAKTSSGINEEEFLDWDKPIVHVEGELDEKRIKAIDVGGVSAFISNFRADKINELKETSNNRDFSQGSSAGGVTSGAAIATLQEAGNKSSRDMINASYRTYKVIAEKVIERMRQFYTEERAFRIVAPDGSNDFINFSNENIKNKAAGSFNNTDFFKKPIFDVRVRAQKRNPFSTLSQNETAINLYNAGFFRIENRDAALGALMLMEFEGKKEIEEYIRQLQPQGAVPEMGGMQNV